MMKFVFALVGALVLVQVGGERRQLSSILGGALPALQNLNIGNLLGHLIGDITGLLSGKTGTIAVPGTQLVLTYNVQSCSVKLFGGRKRIIIQGLLDESCDAEVCENIVTHTCNKCTKRHQSEALQCATQQQVQLLTLLAKNSVVHYTQTITRRPEDV